MHQALATTDDDSPESGEKPQKYDLELIFSLILSGIGLVGLLIFVYLVIKALKLRINGVDDLPQQQKPDAAEQRDTIVGTYIVTTEQNCLDDQASKMETAKVDLAFCSEQRT